MKGYNHPQTPFGVLAQVIVQAFFPMKCPFCGDVVPMKEMACVKCVEELPSSPNNDKKAYVYLDEALSGYSYADKIPNCVSRLKYGHRYLAELAADLMMDAIGKELKSREFDLVLAVPMHPAKLKKRGYNQAEILARALSERLGVEYGENVLAKIKNNGVQHFLSATERRKNVQGVYKVVTSEEVLERRILLIDDVLTTGSTFNECAYVLKIAGAKWVCGTAFAQAVRDDSDPMGKLENDKPKPIKPNQVWEDAECETATLLYEFYQTEDSSVLEGEEAIEEIDLEELSIQEEEEMMAFYQTEDSSILQGEEATEEIQEEYFEIESEAGAMREEDLSAEVGWGDDLGEFDYDDLFESEMENDYI